MSDKISYYIEKNMEVFLEDNTKVIPIDYNNLSNEVKQTNYDKVLILSQDSYRKNIHIIAKELIWNSLIFVKIDNNFDLNIINNDANNVIILSNKVRFNDFESLVFELIESRNKKRNIYKKQLSLVESFSLEFKNIDEAQKISFYLSNSFPNPEKSALGILELCVNAIEHGNLNIGSDLKNALLISGKYHSEIGRRLSFCKNLNKVVKLEYFNLSDKVKVKISDQGTGFDWKKYINMESLNDNQSLNGRGIMLSKKISFDNISYNDIGNIVEVSCNKKHC